MLRNGHALIHMPPIPFILRLVFRATCHNMALCSYNKTKSELRKQMLFLKSTQSWMTSKLLKYDKYCKMGVILFV